MPYFTLMSYFHFTFEQTNITEISGLYYLFHFYYDLTFVYKYSSYILWPGSLTLGCSGTFHVYKKQADTYCPPLAGLQNTYCLTLIC